MSTVATAEGRLRGTSGAGVHRFLGIPFATAARFQPPGPAPSWVGERDATVPGPQAPQLPSMLDRFLGTADLPVSEDCLALNVWTPATDGGRRPVLVWIHGGAFTNGAGSSTWFDGTSFGVRGDCVVVTLSYRLGLLGYTHLADIAGERFTSSGNLGLLDQVEALRWVHRNISAFGGDPGNVTVFGESAGGSAVLSLLATPAAHGLIHRGIAQSASFTQLRSRDRASEAAWDVLAALELGAAEAERLLELPLDALLDAQRTILAQGPPGFTAFAPTPDGEVLPADVVAAATASPIPLLIGATRDEMHLFTFLDESYAALDREGVVGRARPMVGDRAEEVVAAYELARPGSTPGQLASSIASDHSFRLPAVRLADARAANGAATWRYSFTWASTAFGGVLGSCHGLDIPFAFHNLHQPQVEVFTGPGEDRDAVADAMHGAWTSFAVSGEPGWAWKGDRPTMVFDRTSTVVDDPEGDLLALWPGLG